MIHLREANRIRVDQTRSLFNFSNRLSAIDAKLLQPSDISSRVTTSYPLDAQYYVDPDPRLLSKIKEETVYINMTKEEIAVALSHIKAWEQVVLDKVPYALILEDDVIFERKFSAQLNRSWQELPEVRSDGYRFDIFYLSYREVDRGAEKIRFSPNLNRVTRGYWWLSGYVLSLSAAEQLLNLLPVNGPVDLWMNHQFSRFDVYSTPISIISQRTDIKSDNRYSILPLLSQLGIQSDKTHLVLEQTKGQQPVFCIGFDNKGAASLELALSQLGYRCLNDRWGHLSDNIQQVIDSNLPLLFDAYVGIKSITNSFKQLDKLYPGAVFIMPQASFLDDELSLSEFDEIAAYFAGRNNKLLMFDVQEDKWHTLCKFLSCDIPRTQFPRNTELINIPNTFELMPLKDRSTIVLEHDVHPWIVPFERLTNFGILSSKRTFGQKSNTFKKIVDDDFVGFDNSRWAALEDSFPSNLATFRPENIIVLPDNGCELKLVKQKIGTKSYSSASFVSTRVYQYGRFEVTMKPSKADGIVTAFFLHRVNPWQEIDLEFLGRDTTKVLVNVYFNPGDDGTNYNYGNRGTPVMLDLTFDAATDYHQYAIEWEPHELRWFVDDELVHIRAMWEPTPIPNLSMRVYCNLWPSSSSELAGELMDRDLPITSHIKNICIHC